MITQYSGIVRWLIAPYALLFAQAVFGFGVYRRDCARNRERDWFKCFIVMSVFVVASGLGSGGFFVP